MGKNKNHGTASPTQVGEILREVIKAITSVIHQFSASELINCLKGNGSKLAGMMVLVFVALITNQGIVLQQNPKSNFSTWKTITLGTFKTVALLITALKDGGNLIDTWAADIMGKEVFTLSLVEHTIQLVRVSVVDLGFKKGAKLREIYAKALEFGLVLCPSEVGPYLRLQYADQPRDEWVLIAMEPITASDGTLFLFNVGCFGDGDAGLNVDYEHPDLVWSGDSVFVFGRRNYS